MVLFKLVGSLMLKFFTFCTTKPRIHRFTNWAKSWKIVEKYKNSSLTIHYVKVHSIETGRPKHKLRNYVLSIMYLHGPGFRLGRCHSGRGGGGGWGRGLATATSRGVAAAARTVAAAAAVAAGRALFLRLLHDLVYQVQLLFC